MISRIIVASVGSCTAADNPAEKININAWRNEDWFYLRVSDNGSGGADANGEGLRGLRARVEAVDGRLMVDSPAGGPTIIDAWLSFK